MQGQILAVPNATNAGIIAGQDGRRYQFRAGSFRNGQGQSGHSVDFQPSGQEATEIYVVRPAAGPQPRNRNWGAFYFSPYGRVSRRDFWLIGMLPLVAASIFGLIPVIGTVIVIVLTWCWIALSVRRFHDRGHSGWWVLANAPGIVGNSLFSPALPYGAIGYYRFVVALMAIGVVVGLLQVAFVYVRAGQPGPNQYGPDPLEV